MKVCIMKAADVARSRYDIFVNYGGQALTHEHQASRPLNMLSGSRGDSTSVTKYPYVSPLPEAPFKLECY